MTVKLQTKNVDPQDENQSYILVKEDCILINKIVSFEDPYKNISQYVAQETYIDSE
jgi:hypothetical protein